MGTWPLEEAQRQLVIDLTMVPTLVENSQFLHTILTNLFANNILTGELMHQNKK